MSCYYLLNEWRYLTYYLVIILLFRFVGSLIQDRISFFFDSIALYFKVMPLASVTGDLKILWLFGSHYFDIKIKTKLLFQVILSFQLNISLLRNTVIISRCCLEVILMSFLWYFNAMTLYFKTSCHCFELLSHVFDFNSLLFQNSGTVLSYVIILT